MSQFPSNPVTLFSTRMLVVPLSAVSFALMYSWLYSLDGSSRISHSHLLGAPCGRRRNAAFTCCSSLTLAFAQPFKPAGPEPLPWPGYDRRVSPCAAAAALALGRREGNTPGTEPPWPPGTFENAQTPAVTVTEPAHRHPGGSEGNPRPRLHSQ